MTDELNEENTMTVRPFDLGEDRERQRDEAIRAIRALERDDVEMVMHFFGYDDPGSGAFMSSALTKGMADRVKEEHMQMRSFAVASVMNEHRKAKGMDTNFLRAMYLTSLIGSLEYRTAGFELEWINELVEIFKEDSDVAVSISKRLPKAVFLNAVERIQETSGVQV